MFEIEPLNSRFSSLESMIQYVDSLESGSIIDPFASYEHNKLCCIAERYPEKLQKLQNGSFAKV